MHRCLDVSGRVVRASVVEADRPASLDKPGDAQDPSSQCRGTDATVSPRPRDPEPHELVGENRPIEGDVVSNVNPVSQQQLDPPGDLTEGRRAEQLFGADPVNALCAYLTTRVDQSVQLRNDSTIRIQDDRSELDHPTVTIEAGRLDVEYDIASLRSLIAVVQSSGHAADTR